MNLRWRPRLERTGRANDLDETPSGSSLDVADSPEPATHPDGERAREAEEQAPDLRDLERLFTGPIDVRSIALTGLFTMALVLMLQYAKELFLPIVLAVLFKFLLNPVTRALERGRVPGWVASLLVVFGTVAILGLVVQQTYQPARAWLSALPETLRQAGDKVAQLREPVEKVTEIARQVDELATAAAPEEGPQAVQIERGSLSETVFAALRRFAGTVAVTVALLYFLLAAGDLFLRKLVRVLPRLRDKKRAVEIAREIESDVSRYLVTVTLINIGLGVAVAIAMYLLDMPSPVLWGVMATCFNFVPYLGAAVGGAALALAAFVQFDQLSQILLPPLVFLALTSIEGTFVTPTILANRLSLNPVAVVLGLFFWGWLWGIAGALLAVPLLVAIKIFCDRVPPLAAIGEFMGR